MSSARFPAGEIVQFIAHVTYLVIQVPEAELRSFPIGEGKILILFAINCEEDCRRCGLTVGEILVKRVRPAGWN